MIDYHDVEIIRDSVKYLAGHEELFANSFYERLWSDYPVTKKLFATTEINVQKMELIKSILYIISTLDKPSELKDYLFKNGVRHVTYGIHPEHYPMVHSTLKLTLRDVFGKNFSKEIEKSWCLLADLIIEEMKIGALSVRPELKFEG